MAHGDTREGKWRGNLGMEWVASTLHTTSEHGVSSITTADAHNSAASSRLNWRHHRFKWTRPFRGKTKSGFCACAITFQTQSTYCVKSIPMLRLPSILITPITVTAKWSITCNLNRKKELNIFHSAPLDSSVNSYRGQQRNCQPAYYQLTSRKDPEIFVFYQVNVNWYL